jgi:CheY-like chemotaxis protein
MTPATAPEKSVLVVEDDAITREALSLILEEEGYTVVGAANGREAIDCLHTARRPDVIVLDLMMPVMNGWEFRSRQRQDPDLAAIPVIVVSADSHIQQSAAAIGAADYLQKPINFNHLLAAVHRCC